MAESSIISGRVLYIDAGSEQAETRLHALSSSTRLQILNLLRNRVLNVGQIAAELGLPASTATSNINALEEAGLIDTELRPATRGLHKVLRPRLRRHHRGVGARRGRRGAERRGLHRDFGNYPQDIVLRLRYH